MSYCPSQDADRHLGDDDTTCPACGTDDWGDCYCGDVVCLACGYCDGCNAPEFSQLPEEYFQRTCCECKEQMAWGDIKYFSDLISGEPIAVHPDCLEPAKALNAAMYENYKSYQAHEEATINDY